MRHAQVDFLLSERVVDIHQRCIGIEVAHSVVRVLGVYLHVVTFRHALGVVALHKCVPVPLPLTVCPYIVYYCTGYTFLTLVIVPLDVPLALRQIPKQSHLGTPCLHIAVLTDCGRIPRHSTARQYLAVTKMITTMGVGIFSTRRKMDIVSQLLLVQDRWISQAERACLHGEA